MVTGAPIGNADDIGSYSHQLTGVTDVMDRDFSTATWDDRAMAGYDAGNSSWDRYDSGGGGGGTFDCAAGSGTDDSGGGSYDCAASTDCASSDCSADCSSDCSWDCSSDCSSDCSWDCSN
jgi:hypothetical protein